MKANPAVRCFAVEFISLLYICLFVYAAVSKLLDFENFTVQLGQSPLLSAFGGFTAWAVPVSELAIALLLCIPAYRKPGLYLGFGLMVMFTAYIYILLNYSSFVPCSCGGILEKLGWTEHLFFNLAFVALAGAALFLYTGKGSRRDYVVNVSLLAVGCTGFVALLFLVSENVTHYHNTFIRRLPHWPAQKKQVADLGLNSYYIAGCSEGSVYLGNSTAPTLVTVLDSGLTNKKAHHFTVDRDLPFRSINVKVLEPHFFVWDGALPVVYRGNVSDWKAGMLWRGNDYFSLFEPTDPLTAAVRIHRRDNGENVLGLLDLGKGKTRVNAAILEKQIDGVFDTDGFLSYNGDGALVYLYMYRNQYTATDKGLKILTRGKTIDTVSKAQIRIADVKSRNVRKLSAPPLRVNYKCAAYQNLMFVHSALRGKHESAEMWDKASIVDVYDLSDNRYVLSFYVYDHNGKKMREFAVHGDRLYALIGNHLVRYTLEERITKYYKPESIGQLQGKVENL